MAKSRVSKTLSGLKWLLDRQISNEIHAEVRAARCAKRGKYHDENRARAKARKCANNQAKLAAAINAKE